MSDFVNAELVEAKTIPRVAFLPERPLCLDILDPPSTVSTISLSLLARDFT